MGTGDLFSRYFLSAKIVIVAMDVWYTKNVSFVNDIKIIIDTIKAVLKHEGINSETSATMEEFLGAPDGVVSTWKRP